MPAFATNSCIRSHIPVNWAGSAAIADRCSAFRAVGDTARTHRSEVAIPQQDEARWHGQIGGHHSPMFAPSRRPHRHR